MGLPEITLGTVVMRALALLLIAGVHGAALAGAAVLLGDRGPKYDGRLTILPPGHVDLLGAIGLIVFGYGWGKPVAIDARQFRVGRIGILGVILAGFAALIAVAALLDTLALAVLTAMSDTTGLTFAAFLRVTAALSLRAALLSLVPIPPLAGGMVLGLFGIHVSRRAERVLAVLLLVAVAIGLVRQVLVPVAALLAPLVFGG
jgi:membrane-associated protease RseP (regulator of RpoE activity)